MAFSIKRHDTRPAYVADLKDNFGLSNEAAIDLTNATTVTFKMRAAASADTVAPKVSRVVTILDPTLGRVQQTWQVGDTDTVGAFQVEFEIAWNDGGVETVPNGSYLTVNVIEDLDQN
jgi:hypothetical protein